MEAGETSTSNTVAEGEGLVSAVSGQEAHFSVISKDSNGNLVGKGGDAVVVYLVVCWLLLWVVVVVVGAVLVVWLVLSVC